MRAGFPQPPPQLGPSCSCCRKGRVRVVRMVEGQATAAACPECDRVRPVPVNPAGTVMSTRDAFTSAPKAVRPA